MATVKAATVTSTGTLVATPATVLGLYWRSTTTAGTIVLNDNGAGGTTLLTLNTPATTAPEGGFVDIGGGGMVFGTDVHATLTNADAVTVIYLG